MSHDNGQQQATTLDKLAFPIAQLKHDPNNVRLHDERSLAAVRKSLQEFGWRNVVVVRRSDNVILAGNARVTAAREMGWLTAPVLFVHADEQQSARYALLDNRSAELASWDMDVLLRELETMDAATLEIAGFTPEEFAGFAESMADAIEESEAEAESAEAEQQEAAQEQRITLTHTPATEEAPAIVQVRIELTEEQHERWKRALEMAEAAEPQRSVSELALLAVLAQ